MPDLLTIRNARERQFAEVFFSHDEWESQPGPFRLSCGAKYTPDFHDKRRGVLIEVVGSRQVAHFNSAKYALFVQEYPHLKLEFRRPDGTPWGIRKSRPVRFSSPPMNALEAYRQQNNLTFEALAAQAANDKTSVWRHCHAQKVPADAVPGYEERLGIPRWMLRPDLWTPPAIAPTPSPPEAA